MAKKPLDTKKARPSRRLISQADVPGHSLREALTVAQALTDSFAGGPAAPHQVALALNISPTSSNWHRLAGAAVAYGLTKGGSKIDKIALDQLGKRATAPTEEGDDVKARAEAALKPKVCRGFFRRYNRAKFPQDHIALNVLREDLGVPAERCQAVLEILKDNGAFVGFIHNTKTGPFVSMDDLQPIPVAPASESFVVGRPGEEAEIGEGLEALPPTEVVLPHAPAGFRVFISHSKNMAVVDQVKEILGLYDIDYELAVEEETTAIPVPQKILAAMRRCQAGVMVVTGDEQSGTAENLSINTNVLIEIGAAFVLYDQKVVLLWDKRLKVPSNIQGLYRCEFEGNQLSFAVGTKLAKALKGFRK
jgi:hypothetical protein